MIASDNGLASYRRQAIIWTNGGLVYRRIYASPIYALVTCANIDADIGLSSVRCQTIIWTNAELLPRIIFNETLMNIRDFSSHILFWKFRLRNDGHSVAALMII